METLSFKAGNAKLKGIFIFDTPAGHFCPYANDCLSKADRETGKLTDGENIEFRCYAATQENYLPLLRAKRWRNGDLVKETLAKGLAAMTELIHLSLPTRYGIIRIHESGDFLTQTYFDAWLQVARMNPKILFYAYTKSLPFWVRRLEVIPENMVLTASFGGKKDEFIEQYGLKYSKVVGSYEEAERLGLAVDNTDELAYNGKNSFALVIHGTQPKGSDMAKQLYANRKAGHMGYGGSHNKKKNK